MAAVTALTKAAAPYHHQRQLQGLDGVFSAERLLIAKTAAEVLVPLLLHQSFLKEVVECGWKWWLVRSVSLWR